MAVEDARTMALASQYIDDNPATRPTEPGWQVVGSPAVNRDQLLKYHFTIWYKDGDKLVWDNAGLDIDIYQSSYQLPELYGYAASNYTNEGYAVCPIVNNSRLQFMGEYLHAFEDTFSHRNENNIPYSYLGGFGHTEDNENPDFNYNHRGCSPIPGVLCKDWNVNEERTLLMEQRTYDEILRFMTDTNYERIKGSGKKTDFDIIESTLAQFNAIHEHGHFGKKAGSGEEEPTQLKSRKINLLEHSLSFLGYTNDDGSKINLTIPGEPGYQGYNVDLAGSRRLDNYRDVNPSDYPDAMIPIVN